MSRHKVTLPQPDVLSANGKYAWQCPFCERRSNFGHTRASALKGGRTHLWAWHKDKDRLRQGGL